MQSQRCEAAVGLSQRAWAAHGDNTHEPNCDFVYVDRLVPGILVDLRYATNNNFTGEVVEGYCGKRAIMTRKAAAALGRAETEAHIMGLRLLIWDAYRPQPAVNAFMRWRSAPVNAAAKAKYFPDLTKEQIFEQGLIASPSGHSRGSTVDLTLVSSPNSLTANASGQSSTQPLNMGGQFDLFSPSSATEYADLSPEERANRSRLCSLMHRHGFNNLASEWWHYTLRDEPFPDTHFDFEVRDDWKQLDRQGSDLIHEILPEAENSAELGDEDVSA